MHDEFLGKFGERVRFDEPMSGHTTFGIGGPVDVFVEVSHVDRSVGLYLTRDDLDPTALSLVKGLDYSGLAHDYLTYLFAEGDRLTQEMRPLPSSNHELTDRQNVNLGVLRRGWELLGSYLVDRANFYLEELDVSSLVAEWKLASSSDPVLDAVKWAFHSGKDSVWKPQH